MSDSSNQPPVPSSWSDAEDGLDSWKEIAAYLDRDTSTVRRWEQRESLPVHRHAHHKLATVYAYRSEIDGWLEDRHPGGKIRKSPDRVGFFGRNKKTAAGITIGLAFIVFAALLWWARPDLASPPTKSLDFQERDWVLIADFENRTGEAVVDGVLEHALRREIANSQFVNVVPRERINDTLQLMRKPLDKRIDPEVGREISLRDGGIRALLIGRVEKLDSTYLLSIELVDPTQGQIIAATSEEAAGQGQLLTAVRLLSNWARETLGEKLALIQESERTLEKVATFSLRAVQLFTEARTLFDRGPIWHGSAEELLKQAVEIDPEFASAHIWLAWTLRNQSKSFDDYIEHAEWAFQLAEATSEQERYFIHGSYYWMKGELDRAIHAFEALLALYPDHFWATHKLAELYRETGQERRALTYLLRRADLRPNNFRANMGAARDLIHLHSNLPRASKYLEGARRALTDDIIQEGGTSVVKVMLLSAQEAWLRGNPEAALAEIGEVSQKLESLGISGYAMLPLATLYHIFGQSPTRP